MKDTRAFYDDLAEDYDLVYADWEASMRRQAEVIEGWFDADGPRRVLDAACGLGTQAIGLALRGHRVVGRDLSPRLVERAKETASRFGVELDLAVADLRELSFENEFDYVLALDNALPHLESDDDLERALGNVGCALRPGGRFFASTRDYDRLAAERPALDPPRVLGEGAERRIVLQLWDWDDDGGGYSLDHLIARRSTDGSWSLRSRTGRYRALLRRELDAAAARSGFTDTRWIEPEVSGFFQPVFSAGWLASSNPPGPRSDPPE